MARKLAFAVITAIAVIAVGVTACQNPDADKKWNDCIAQAVARGHLDSGGRSLTSEGWRIARECYTRD